MSFISPLSTLIQLISNFLKEKKTRIMGRFVTLFSVLLIASLSISPSKGQSCKSYTFPNNQKFSSCNDLPVLNTFLHWTYDSSAGTANIDFRAAGVSPSNWIAWALNPTGTGMLGAQALVAYRISSAGAVHAYTSSITTYSTTLAHSSISFQVSNLSAMSTSNNEMIIFATIKPPNTKVNQVWQVGPLSRGTPVAHPTTGNNIKSTGTIDFLSGQTASTGTATSALKKKNRSFF